MSGKRLGTGNPVILEVVGRRIAPGAIATDDFTYSIIDARPAQRKGVERRGEGRTRSRLREGTIGEVRSRRIGDCVIRDLSRTGARLRLDRDLPLPRTFLLTEAGRLGSFWATLVWQVGRDAGVRLSPADAPPG